jgi:hypothetical protein
LHPKKALRPEPAHGVIASLDEDGADHGLVALRVKLFHGAGRVDFGQLAQVRDEVVSEVGDKLEA